MKTYAERIEDEKRAAAEKIAELAREAELAARLPEGTEAPRAIHLFEPAPWICYAVETIHDALNLARKFPEPAEVSAVEHGCLSVQPPELQAERYAKNGKERWREPGLMSLKQHGGRGFFSAQLVFWVQDFAGLPWARIVIGINTLDYRLRGRMNAHYDRHGEVTQAEFIEPADLAANATRRIKWGAGSRDAFAVDYFFSGPDHLEDFLRNYPKYA